MLFAKLFLAMCFMTLNLSLLSRATDSPNDILKAHNKYRAEVGAPPLDWDDSLATYAQEYADKTKVNCEMNDSIQPYGVNLASLSGKMSITDAVKYWAAEKYDYDHASNTCKGGGFACIHYAQVVSKASFSVGCAEAKCANGRKYVVCNYNPPGNIEGQKPY
ncbi:hypothetical protein like AT4G33720 [Hibiscus trionum]|uniref:SCP domain-containing protein n=1 Tax=Hibiscus trionum TaxID=183268 RepID=A0A9W7IMA8_HIBTR|nr:hypothetical protein like AT4G33720 [Hibiscus trionum]GMI97658.1 hypothetical protein like AT4G33720 [Hibiscus trionum]